MALTAKQKKFINEYFQDFNGTRAAERSGYAGDDNTLAVTAHGLLRNPKIAEVVSRRLQESAMSADEVLQRLAEQARSEHTRYITNRPRLDMIRMAMDSKGDLIPAVIDENGDIDVAQMARDGVLELYAPYIDTTPFVDLDAMRSDGMMHLVKGIKNTKDGLQVEFYDAQSALVHIGKNHVLFTDKSESVNYDVDLSKLTDEQLERLANNENIKDVLRDGNTAST